MNARHVRIFNQGRNQVIRIPRELELPTSKATIRREGSRLVIEPVERVSLLALLASWEPIDAHLSEFSDEAPDAVVL